MTGHEISNLRLDAAMTVNDFAGFCGVEPRTVFRWEAQKQREVPLAEWARRVVAAFHGLKPAERRVLALIFRDDGWRKAWARLFEMKRSA